MVEPLFRTAFATPPAVGLAVTLGGSEGKHAVNVRRMRVGEGIQLSDGKGLRVRGEVSALGNSSLTVQVSEVSKPPADDGGQSVEIPEAEDDPYAEKLAATDDADVDFLESAVLAKIMGNSGAADA